MARNVYSVCFLILFLKMWATNFRQGLASTRAQSRTKEDYGLLMEKRDVSEEEKQDELRWKRQVLNDLENIPISLLIYLFSNYVSVQQHAHMCNIVTICIFTFSRIAFTICYAYAWQPFRSIFYIIGQLCTLTAGITAVQQAFKYS
ncbi:hypothetical protein PPERSA_11609 [Pseudocohnilembus persalinus]|uniref:Microsomal glutathione S-transferase 1 n=1 Tax=Pseudocohnilembus persalinus TaxID=266149 RepID=A0A0V0QA13_PSEPJ|nr:hypothetical protein PPERSA_11609 [Pseudocohnilembus persalinus]|eukprot:KRW99008.1 hypothetical protein PPERSA_11609 [Pseudocohnilembus persalinus]